MLRRRKRLNQRGFTMVELLAAVTIVAVVTLIAVKGVSGMIERAKVERTVQQQKALIIATESYLQANSQLKPKTIGESRIISAMDLKKANYLKADIVNADGESCMSESKVRVYKLSKMEYSYYPYIYCGDEKAPDTIDPPTPYISTYFTDATGDRYPSDHVFTDVSKARLAIVLKGEENENIPIDGYSYAIDSVDSTGRRTVFDSGSLSANRQSELLIYVDLKDYIDVSDKTEFYISIFVRNVHGGEYSFEGSLDVTGSGVGKYEDTIPPICADIQNQAAAGEWINKYSAVKERTITALCEDGDGSGCVRDSFSRTWPNKSQQSAEYAYIRVSDNRGNKTPNRDDYQTASCNPGSMCCVRVNVDVVSPTIKILRTQKYNGSSLDGQNILSPDIKDVTNKNDTITINTPDISGYDDTVSDEGWLNLKNFTHGIGFVFKVSDDIGLDNWKWETNVDDIWTSTDDRLGALSIYNTDGAHYEFDTNQRITSPSNEFTIYFKGNGRRKGILTVRDIAGNESKYVMNINLDTREVEVMSGNCDDDGSCPPVDCSDNSCTPNCDGEDDCPPPSKQKFANTGLRLNKYLEPTNRNIGEPYVPGTWSNLSVIASPADYVIDFIEDNPGTTFKYLVYKENSGVAGHSAATAIIDGPHTSRNNRYYFDNSVSPDTNGMNTIALVVCSIGGNCVQTENYKVNIDTVAPECSLDAVTSDGYSYDGSYWLKKGRNAIVTASCSEKTEGNYTKSGCENSSQWPSQFSFTYDFDALSYIAGAKGLDVDGNTHGAVRDKAGNVTECPANKIVMIDHTDPVCTVEAKLNNNTNYNGSTWGKYGDKITVTGSCTDKGGSGSGSGCMIYTGNMPTFDSSKTNASFVYEKKDYNTTAASPFGLSKNAYVVDGAGNTVTCAKKTVKLDVTAPTCGNRTGAAANKNSWRNNSSITVTQKCSDDTSGCDFTKGTSTGCNTATSSKTCTCSSSSSSCSRTYTSDITSDYIDLYDVAGNTSRCSYYVNRDTVAPECGAKDTPEPTTPALERKRTVGCIKGTGSAVSPCAQDTFSKTWTYAVNGKVDNDVIPISDKAGNTKDCPVKVLIDKEDDSSLCTLVGSTGLFGTDINDGPKTVSSQNITYHHIDKEISDSYVVDYTDYSTTWFYNYLPVRKSTGNFQWLSFTRNTRNAGNGLTLPYAYGFLTNDYWGEGWCNPASSTNSCGYTRYCYARVCVGDKCGKYKGWTADAMNVEAIRLWDLHKNDDAETKKKYQKCHCVQNGKEVNCFSRCWCGCSHTNDFYNTSTNWS